MSEQELCPYCYADEHDITDITELLGSDSASQQWFWLSKHEQHSGRLE